MAIITGTDGADRLNGTPQPDQISGLGGNDTIFGSAQFDQINGGAGFDTVDYRSAATFISAIIFSPTGFTILKDSASTRQGPSDLVSGVEQIIAPEAGRNILFPGSYNGNSVFVDLGLNLVSFYNPTTGALSTVRAKNFVDVTGGDEIDGIIGNSKANRLDGGRGNDALFGRGGDDRLIGNLGNDILAGGSGNDVLLGTLDSPPGFGLGEQDMLSGGAGQDRFILGNSATSFYQDGGNSDFVRILDLEAQDRIQLSSKDSYRLQTKPNGFNLFSTGHGTPDLLADVHFRGGQPIAGLPQNNFQIAAGQTLSVFVGV
jgi:Ca2+-binding RTX toxin-like protein